MIDQRCKSPVLDFGEGFRLQRGRVLIQLQDRFHVMMLEMYVISVQ